MLCKNCGAPLADGDALCPQCGQAQLASPTLLKDHRTANIVLLVVSILTCGFVSADAVLALLGIVFASQARKHNEAGRTAFAQDKADTARWMAICSGITMGVRVLFAIGYIIFMVIYGVSMLLDIK